MGHPLPHGRTGGWLGGRRVLISPFSVTHTDWSGNRLDVALTKEQVEHSPEINTHQPVSRQHEATYLGYYGYPYYWGGPYLWGPAFYPAGWSGSPHASAEADGREDPERVDGFASNAVAKPSLVITLRRLTVKSAMWMGLSWDEEPWAIRYIEVATRNWWRAKRCWFRPRGLNG